MIDPAQPKQTISVGTGIGGAGKEIEPAATLSSEAQSLKEVGHEVVLPPEVTAAGVKLTPTTVAVPPKVSQMGVTAVGQSTPPPAISVTLPLNDEQIAQGLHQSIMSSWRWLAEWCIRRLKKVHLGLKTIHGKIMRVVYA